MLLSPKIHRQFQAANVRRLAAAAGAGIDWGAQQLQSLRKVWTDAVSDVPYYGSLVAADQAPREIRSWSDFQNIPILGRQAIQDHQDAFLRKSGPPDDFTKTAGSTGTPLRLGMNQAERDQMRIVKLAAWQKFGYTPASRLFLIWGHSHLLGTGWKGKVNNLKRKLADAWVGYQRVDAYRLNRASCAEYAEKLLRFRPLGLIGYASALDLFARYTQPFRERFRALGMRFVLSTAEPAPTQETFALLEDLFGCPVVQEYGGAEFGQIAFKTGHGPFEVYSDLNYVECAAPEDNDADSHPVLVTTLYPRYVPLIRYRTGDAISGCSRLDYGHVLRFDILAGRLNDVIQLADGDSIHSVAIFHCIHQEPTVHNIQMLLKDNSIEIRLITTGKTDVRIEERIRKRLAQVHPLLRQACFIYTEDLVTNRAGKRRWFVDERTKFQRNA